MVAAISSLLPALGGLLGLGASMMTKKKAETPTQPLPGATRDDAAAKTAMDDELLRRKGGAADILTGVRGAEAPSAKLKLALGA